MKKENKSLKVLISILALMLLGLGAALQVKAAIGLGPWDALTATISELTNLKFGTASIISNSIMILLQVLILRKAFKMSYWLQVPIVLLFGTVVNFFLYNIVTFEIIHYQQSLIVFFLGNLLAALALSLLVSIDIITMPPEGFSSAVAKVSKFDFSQVRLSIDIVSVIFCLLSTFLFDTKLQIREGTILAIVLFNLFLRIFIKIVKPKMDKL